MEIAHERHRIRSSLRRARHHVAQPQENSAFPNWRSSRSLQSIMFVLLFAYVFGGQFRYLTGKLQGIPDAGIFVQTIAFASATTAIGIADDMGKGLIDRFRSLPMARSAVLTWRTIADVIYRRDSRRADARWPRRGVEGEQRVRQVHLRSRVIAGFAYVMAWIGVWIGLSVPNTETAQQLTFVTIFPLTFIFRMFCSASVIARNLAADSRVEPVSTLTASCRSSSAIKPDDWYGVPQPAPGLR